LLDEPMADPKWLTKRGEQAQLEGQLQDEVAGPIGPLGLNDDPTIRSRKARDFAFMYLAGSRDPRPLECPRELPIARYWMSSKRKGGRKRPDVPNARRLLVGARRSAHVV
jgi:hypothetical protein